jgi:two-component system, OmpR family, response regulator
MRILLIEDDVRLAALISQVLEEEHFSVDMFHDGNLGLEQALTGTYDAAIIDWMLPGRDGPSICRQVRAAQIILPILMLTARSQVEDRVAGLNSGADDYLVKPFAMDELIARLYALGRRFNPTSVDAWELRVGNLVMDLRAHTARRAEHVLDLTRTEWALLEYLMRHAGQTLPRQNILNYVWSYEKEVQPGLVDVYISYLRAKLDLPGVKDPVQTVRGIGYRLEKDDA